jgi:outer membrane receptor protein involved in Fe transport
MRKDNFIFRDASGFNVSDGKTRHVGLEFEMLLNLTGGFYAHVAATTARHTYRFDRDASRGEQIRRGAIVDTAPRIVGSSRLGWRGDRASVEAEWLHQGSYWLNAANTARYDGHDLANLRLSMNIARSWQLSLRLNNVFDRRYAERADFAFGSYRYSPGRGRETFVEIGFRQAR